MKDLTEEGRGLIRDLCQTAHPANVLQVVQEYCQDQAEFCATTLSMSGGIAREWRQAATHIGKAIEEIAE